MRLSILIATVGERTECFMDLVAALATQVPPYKNQIEVLIYWNNFEKPLAEIRQALVEEAKGDYVCFIDDDDSVPPYYCDRIMEALTTSPDYVGWRMQLWWNGEKMKPTYHSIRYPEWSDDAHGYYRNTSHLNPIKREIALQVPFIGDDGPEDVSWGARVAPLVKTEEYIEDCMYYYHFNQANSIWQGKQVPEGKIYRRPWLRKPFRYHPDCKSVYPEGTPG